MSKQHDPGDPGGTRVDNRCEGWQEADNDTDQSLPEQTSHDHVVEMETEPYHEGENMGMTADPSNIKVRGYVYA